MPSSSPNMAGSTSMSGRSGRASRSGCASRSSTPASAFRKPRRHASSTASPRPTRPSPAALAAAGSAPPSPSSWWKRWAGKSACTAARAKARPSGSSCRSRCRRQAPPHRTNISMRRCGSAILAGSELAIRIQTVIRNWGAETVLGGQHHPARRRAVRLFVGRHAPGRGGGGTQRAAGRSGAPFCACCATTPAWPRCRSS